MHQSQPTGSGRRAAGSVVATLLLAAWLALAGGQAGAQQVTSYDISHSTSNENINVDQRRTNNFHIQAERYQPTQLNQLVLNMPKQSWKAKSRLSRPPTRDELAVKQRVTQLFQLLADELRASVGQQAWQRLEPRLAHLGRVLAALNPKYVATERLRRAAFAEGPAPAVEPPEWAALAARGPALELRAGRPLRAQLGEALASFGQLTVWTPAFVEQLAGELPRLAGGERALGALVLCLERGQQCAGQQEPELDADLEAEPELGPAEPQPAASQPAPSFLWPAPQPLQARQFMRDRMHDFYGPLVSPPAQQVQPAQAPQSPQSAHFQPDKGAALGPAGEPEAAPPSPPERMRPRWQPRRYSQPPLGQRYSAAGAAAYAS